MFIKAYELRLKDDYFHLPSRLEDAELLRQALYAKQGRSSQFRSRKERDAWLGKEIQEIDRTVMTQQQQVNV